jgi:hypothetical protein
MLNVDSGYLTFKLAFGGFDSWVMKHGQQVSMFAIDNKPKRRELYPAYKQHRNTGDDKQAVVQMVWELRKRVETEALLPLCSIEGLEADDLVACWYLFNSHNHIVGVDKDFFQLPDLEFVYYHNFNYYHRDSAIEKMPEYVKELAERNFALYQILLGDVADNIPRLLAKGKQGKEQIEQALYADDLGELDTWLIDTYGEQAKINAALVLLPFYTYCDYDFLVFDDWFDCWSSGHYYDQGNWQRLYLKMQQCMLPNRVKQDVETLEMFSLI